MHIQYNTVQGNIIQYDTIHYNKMQYDNASACKRNMIYICTRVVRKDGGKRSCEHPPSAKRPTPYEKAIQNPHTYGYTNHKLLNDNNHNTAQMFTKL